MRKPSKPRRRQRWLIVGCFLLIVGALGLGWWFYSSDELTAEEQAFVGWWKPTDPYPNLKSASPFITVAIEYRPDRTQRLLRRSTQTGEVYLENYGQQWKVVDGHMFTTVPNPYPLQSVLGGDVRINLRSEYRITWDGPDRFLMDRVDLPPGVTWPTFVKTRYDPTGMP